ncbi:ABC transporter permease [Amycolatopsis sp. FDAARGOS 1241]|uniref:ABC transporter permease n=1 Tax=Amycolatopsis sp. FDAARGOS 1241 TaxID=2778070 RepID=UPI0019524CEA|nr:ABC transporter permease [Amycolatopsis sp. FDAARGOS 1241]QRP42610.1 ABC transporter permease [Amycolatopsis sp. FDAARGOS 1241]
MLRYALRRIPSMLLTLFLASVAIFGLTRLVPGSTVTAIAGSNATPATIQAITRDLGLDRPLPEQYWRWLHGLLTGDLQRSAVLGQPIGQLIARGLGATVELTVAAAVLAALLAFVLGVLGATSRRAFVRGAARSVMTFALAVPPYVSGTALIVVFGVLVPVFPVGGRVSLLQDPELGWQYLVLPALCLALPVSAVLGRFLADGLDQAFTEDFTRTATALGVRRGRLITVHALPNALPPVLTVAGIQLGNLLAGSAIVEALFAWPGVGQLLIQAITNHDYLLVQDLLLIAVTAFLVLQLLTDLGQAGLDQRTRLGGRS